MVKPRTPKALSMGCESYEHARGLRDTSRTLQRTTISRHPGDKHTHLSSPLVPTGAEISPAASASHLPLRAFPSQVQLKQSQLEEMVQSRDGLTLFRDDNDSDTRYLCPGSSSSSSSI